MSGWVSGVFAARDGLVAAIQLLRAEGFQDLHALTPVPDPQVQDALAHPPTRVGLFTLLGGLFGVTLGFGGAAWCHLQWPVTFAGGKPIVSLPPFVIPGFELTILFGGLLTLAGAILLSRLPHRHQHPHYDPRATCDHYVLLVHTTAGRLEAAGDILALQGAEVRHDPG